MYGRPRLVSATFSKFLIVCKKHLGVFQVLFYFKSLVILVEIRKIMVLRYLIPVFLIFQAICTHSQPVTDKPLIVGHRGGYDTILPENSIAMFDFTALKACFQPIAVEFDLRRSANGSLFVMHDQSVDRTTNGNGKISQLSDGYLKTIFLKDRNEKITNEKIPLFSELLARFQDKNIILMLDCKDDVFPEAIKMVSDMKMGSKCIFLTFNLKDTKLVHEQSTGIFISALVKTNADWDSLTKLRVPCRYLIAYVTRETPQELVREISRTNVRVMTDISECIYNNSQPYDTNYYRNLLVERYLDIIISDFPLFVNKAFCMD